MKTYRLLNHSHKILSRSVSTKDMILKKHFTGSLTTEEFLEIDKQPSNTCPMIDPVQKKIEVEIDELDDIIKIELPKLYWSDSCDSCSNDEIFKNNLQQAEAAISDAKNFRDQLEEAKEYLENLRADCENLRAHGLSIKGLIWSIPETEHLDQLRKDLLDLISSPPQDKFSYKKYSQLYPDGEYVSKIEIESFNNCDNEKCCFHSRLLTEMEELSDLLPTSRISEEDCSDAMDNYDKISEWVSYLGDKALELINDAEKVNQMKKESDINAFVEEYQKDFNNAYMSIWNGVKSGDLLYDMELLNKSIKENLLDLDVNDCLEYLLVKDIFNKIKEYSIKIDGINLSQNLQEHQQITRSAFDEIQPKIDALSEMVYPVFINKILEKTNPLLYSQYNNLFKVGCEFKKIKFLYRGSAYQSFFVEEI